MDVTTAKFLIVYIAAIIITDVVTWRLGIPLIWRIVCAFIVAAVLIVLRQVLGIK
jgi:hypothetical protein